MKIKFETVPDGNTDAVVVLYRRRWWPIVPIDAAGFSDPLMNWRRRRAENARETWIIRHFLFMSCVHVVHVSWMDTEREPDRRAESLAILFFLDDRDRAVYNSACCIFIYTHRCLIAFPSKNKIQSRLSFDDLDPITSSWWGTCVYRY